MIRIFFIWLILIIPGALQAHPHIFVDAAIKVIVDRNNIKAVEVQWLFDEMYSVAAIMDYDLDGNGDLSVDEAATLRKDATDVLGDVNYFTYISIDEMPLEIRKVSSFKSEVIDGRLSYRFLIPINYTANGDFPGLIRLAAYDPEFFSSFELDAKNVNIFSAGLLNVERFKRVNHFDTENWGRIPFNEFTYKISQK